MPEGGPGDERRIRLLCRISFAMARPGAPGLDDALGACASSDDVSATDVEEAILQGIPYAGFPAAVEALGSWRDRHEPRRASPGGEGEGGGGRAGAPRRRAARAREGARVFRTVYGPVAPRVRAELERRHPLLERWIISFAYGEVMAGSGLAARDIEALAVASLMGLERRAPLRSHLRGALRTGWTQEGLSALLGSLGGACSPALLDYARSVMADGGIASGE